MDEDDLMQEVEADKEMRLSMNLCKSDILKKKKAEDVMDTGYDDGGGDDEEDEDDQQSSSTSFSMHFPLGKALIMSSRPMMRKALSSSRKERKPRKTVLRTVCPSRR